jgi:uncharacterized protein (DUF302 family)
MTDDGLINIASRHSAQDTMQRLIAALPARNMSVFARIDHAANAVGAGLSLRPTELVVFGNPKGGTFLMQERQAAGLDLPLKALVWEDADGKAWVTYSDPAWIAQRYGLTHLAPVQAMSAALQAIVQDATA